MADAREAASFEREQGFTDAEWRRSLPGAVRGAALELSDGQARVQLPGGGTLQLRWQVLPPRRIALITLPRLAVQYRFSGTDPAAQAAFMAYFDLYMQRGGG